MAIRVTVEDTEDGTTETTVVADYLLIVAEPCYLARRKASPNGTHMLTLKRAHRPGFTVDETFVPAVTP
jgi:hypothetical protein